MASLTLYGVGYVGHSRGSEQQRAVNQRVLGAAWQTSGLYIMRNSVILVPPPNNNKPPVEPKSVNTVEPLTFPSIISTKLAIAPLTTTGASHEVVVNCCFILVPIWWKVLTAS